MARFRLGRVGVALLIALGVQAPGLTLAPQLAVAQDCGLGSGLINIQIPIAINLGDTTAQEPNGCGLGDATSHVSAPSPTEETLQEQIQRQVDERLAEAEARVAGARNEARNRACSNPNTPPWMLAGLGC